MFFYVQGPNKHDLMPLEQIFDRRDIKETAPIKASKTLDLEQLQLHDNTLKETSQKNPQSSAASYAYQAIEKLPDNGPALFARQIMASPVVSLTASMTVDQALKLFQTKRLRHLPVISSAGKVTGMVSDRDILEYMAGLHERYKKNPLPHRTSDKVEQLMQSPVLTASLETDIRYIARLFVEQRVGAMPIVYDGELKGIITRSDILHAVMNHYQLELWI